MRKLLTLIFILSILVSGCIKNDTPIYSGGWTEDDVKVMEASWCEYNKGRDFAKEHCVDYWVD